MRSTWSLASLLLLAFIGPELARANHSAPATYTGTTSVGGSVSFDVAADGGSVTRFERSGVTLSCGPSGSSYLAPVTITNHAFSYMPPSGTHFSGSFPSPGQASGSLGYSGMGCMNTDVTWTARAPVTAPPPPPPAGPPPPGPPPPPGADTVPPPIGMSDFSYSLRGINFEVNCGGQACTVSARGTVTVPNVAKVYRLRPASATIPSGGTRSLRLRLPRAAVTAARRAIAKRTKVVAKVVVTATDAAGNRATRTRSLRLRR